MGAPFALRRSYRALLHALRSVTHLHPSCCTLINVVIAIAHLSDPCADLANANANANANTNANANAMSPLRVLIDCEDNLFVTQMHAPPIFNYGGVTVLAFDLDNVSWHHIQQALPHITVVIRTEVNVSVHNATRATMKAGKATLEVDLCRHRFVGCYRFSIHLHLRGRCLSNRISYVWDRPSCEWKLQKDYARSDLTSTNSSSAASFCVSSPCCVACSTKAWASIVASEEAEAEAETEESR